MFRLPMAEFISQMFDQEQKYLLSMELTPLDLHRLDDAVNRAIEHSEQKRQECANMGLTVAAGMTWPATINVLTRLKLKLKALLQECK